MKRVPDPRRRPTFDMPKVSIVCRLVPIPPGSTPPYQSSQRSPEHWGRWSAKCRREMAQAARGCLLSIKYSEQLHKDPGAVHCRRICMATSGRPLRDQSGPGGQIPCGKKTRDTEPVPVQALFSYIHCHLFTLSGETYASICRLADPLQSYESSTPTWRKGYDWQDLEGSRREKNSIFD